MKKTKIIGVIICLLSCMTLLCSCSSKSFAGDMNMNAGAAAEGGYFGWDEDLAEPDVPMEVESMAVPDIMPSTSGAPDMNEAAQQSSEDKIIKNGSLTVETLEYDKFISDLENSVSAYGGYIESSSGYGYQTGSRWAEYTVRIPSQNYDAFVNKVGDLGSVIESRESVENVTLQYVDIEARLAALTAERDSFMALMEKAETIEEILQIQSYLTDVNYQIESYTSQLNTLKNKVSYSTVNISVNEVERVTPPTPKTVGERISGGFKESLYNISEDMKNLFVSTVVSLPYILIYAVVIAIIVTVIVLIVKANKKKQLKRLEAYRAEQSRQDPENKA